MRKKFLIALIALSLVFVPQLASASSLQDQINALNKQIAERQNVLDGISTQANTLQAKVDSINAEIEKYQAEIDLANLQIEQTIAQINETIAKLEKQKRIMFENAKVLYKQGDPSTIEVLASSDNFTDFVNKQEYLERVKEAVNKAAREFITLKADLEKKQGELQNYAKDQEAKKSVVQLKYDEQADLLAQTRGEESAYQSLVAADTAQRNAAMAQLAASTRSSQSNVVYGGTGGYPYAGAGGSNWDFNGCWGPDPWSFCERHCTSYVAWKVAAVHGYMAPDWIPGNASQWPSRASEDGIPVNNSPAKNSAAVNPNVACSGGFCYGHVMWVEEVLNGGAQVRVSQFNADAMGNYSEATVSSSGLTFIHFEQ